MKKTICIAGIGMLLTGCANRFPSEVYSGHFNFPLVNPDHTHMQRLLANAMAYVKPENKLVDPHSGYPVEGWNHDPENGMYLRSFTQLTAIGEHAEILANIAAGYADNPYISEDMALDQLEKLTETLIKDQANPAVSAKGLLVNFLGFDSAKRIGPLQEEVEKARFVDALGQEQANAVWNALAARKWIIPQQDGSFAKIPRKGEYGDKYFTGELAPFAESNLCATIMGVLDQRGVQIIFGDNANLTASIAKTIGALRHSTIRDNSQAIRLCDRLEQFIERQESGYRHLYDEKAGTFVFGWNATQNRFTGWEDSNGKWIVGHMDYFVNEFRGPMCFVVQRFDLPAAAVKNSGFKIKPYRMADGRDLYTLATWHGSAFQSLGLTFFMQEVDMPGWWENLENAVAINLDYATRHNLPGFLSESYSGNGVEYTGDIGIADIAVTDHERITNAPSLYTLGTAYSISPDAVEEFLAENFRTIGLLMTDHGPWEGYSTATQKPIQFQTTAHTLALLLGGIGSAEENMQRYLTWQGTVSLSKVQGGESVAFDFLSDRAKWISWSPSGDSLELLRWLGGCRIRTESARDSAITP
ncbi:MAG: hypothetical protein FJ220_01040, partial [Kiritimatiellaceae bacterium]|nr:hypothetical protein [Kiritimatiellaceae bacterium]